MPLPDGASILKQSNSTIHYGPAEELPTIGTTRPLSHCGGHVESKMHVAHISP
jgi:hypothetical protein